MFVWKKFIRDVQTSPSTPYFKKRPRTSPSYRLYNKLRRTEEYRSEDESLANMNEIHPTNLSDLGKVKEHLHQALDEINILRHAVKAALRKEQISEDKSTSLSSENQQLENISDSGQQRMDTEPLKDENQNATNSVQQCGMDEQMEVVEKQTVIVNTEESEKIMNSETILENPMDNDFKSKDGKCNSSSNNNLGENTKKNKRLTNDSIPKSKKTTEKKKSITIETNNTAMTSKGLKLFGKWPAPKTESSSDSVADDTSEDSDLNFLPEPMYKVFLQLPPGETCLSVFKLMEKANVECVRDVVIINEPHESKAVVTFEDENNQKKALEQNGKLFIQGKPVQIKPHKEDAIWQPKMKINKQNKNKKVKKKKPQKSMNM